MIPARTAARPRTAAPPVAAAARSVALSTVALRVAATALCALALLAVPRAHALADTAAPMGYDDARHLLARTGFGPTEAEVRTYAALTREAAVARLLGEARTVAVTPPPAAATSTEPFAPPRAMASAEERKAFAQAQVREGIALRGWWLEEMLVTPSPLTERMTLFWHNHFVSGQQKVRVARLMYGQNLLLRANALGNFGTLLHAIARDPAMVVYLDSAQNRRGTPNENFARELMELFTLGEGRYTEQDVKEAARAFTGWSLDRQTGSFVFRRALHDAGPKTVLGRSGNLDGDDVLALLLARPETATFVTTKLWREFVSPDPDPAAVERIAARFRDAHYDIRAALAALLGSDAFWTPANRGVLVKSPLDVVVGTLRTLELDPAQGVPFALAAAGMGQNLMSPPNVKGWPGGEAWINTATLLARKQFLDRLLRLDERAPAMMEARLDVPPPAAAPDGPPPPKSALAANGADAAAEDRARAQRFLRAAERSIATVRFDSARWMAQFPGASAAARSRAAERLLLATPAQNVPDYGVDSLAFVRGIVLDAAYQLK